MARLHAIEKPLPAAKSEIRVFAERLTPLRRAGDFAQAMMDLGATICTPRKPACALCPFVDACIARGRGEQETFPRKSPKRTPVERFGAAFVLTDARGRLLARSRAPKGLLGGMTETPTTEWSPSFDRASALQHAPTPAGWRMAGEVTHVFTHFPLTLDVYVADVATMAPPPGARWIEADEISGEAFPDLFRKVLAAAGIAP